MSLERVAPIRMQIYKIILIIVLNRDIFLYMKEIHTRSFSIFSDFFDTNFAESGNFDKTNLAESGISV